MCSDGYSIWVCLCVYLSVKSHLTSGVSVRPENTVTYSVSNGGQKICGFFSETAPFQRYMHYFLHCTAICAVGQFLKPHMRITSIAIAQAFSRIRARMAPRVLHFSALI